MIRPFELELELEIFDALIPTLNASYSEGPSEGHATSFILISFRSFVTPFNLYLYHSAISPEYYQQSIAISSSSQDPLSDR